MKTKEDIKEVLRLIKYKDWILFLGQDSGGRMYLQCQWQGPDSISGRMDLQKARKWWLSPYMTTTELVRTAYKAVLAAEEHEAAENFSYKGFQIYSPHMNVELLVHVRCEQDANDERPDPPAEPDFAL